jgi:type IV pilus assembly protein PilV
VKRRQTGITLIDVMVAILLLAVGILGMVALQAVTVQNSVNAEYRATAALLADELTSYFIGSATNGSNTAVDVTTTTFYTNWKTKVANLLPSGTGSAPAGSTTSLTVTITWQPVTGKVTSGPNVNSGTDQYVTTVSWP